MLNAADSMGIREIWGSVMPSDIRAQPALLDWYRKHGFVVVDSDHECVAGAEKKIVRRR